MTNKADMTDTNKEREADALIRKLRDVLDESRSYIGAPSFSPSMDGEAADAVALADHYLAGRASLSAEAEPTDDVKQKIASNQWDHFGDLLPTLKAISRGDWYWGANSRCKYIEIRLDTRDGGCLLFDRERVRISPEQFAHQSYGGFKMDPWPASSSLAAPAQAPAPGHSAKDLKKLRKALIRAQQAINSMKVEAETAAQGDKRMMLEACETISNEGLQADMAIRDALAAPSSGKGG